MNSLLHLIAVMLLLVLTGLLKLIGTDKPSRNFWQGGGGVHLRAGGGNMGTADVGVPSGRANIVTTGASWLERLGAESERKAIMRKKAGGTGGQK